jgi:uncharacterized membrane protein
MLTYNLQITNSGSLADEYRLSVGGNTWPTLLSSDLLSLAPGMTADVQITVGIPLDSIGGATDLAVLHVESMGDVSDSQDVIIQSTALFRNRIPLLRK